MIQFSGATGGRLSPSAIRSSTVVKGVFFSAPGMGNMKMSSSGMERALVALRAVSSRGTHVKRALAPDDRSWCSSSDAEYAALAGLTMPFTRWTAWVKGM